MPKSCNWHRFSDSVACSSKRDCVSEKEVLKNVEFNVCKAVGVLEQL
jgi:hypothetical protein